MPHAHVRNTVVKTLVVMVLAAALGGNALGADYTVHVVDPPVTNHVILPDGPLPPVCQEAQEITLYACRGEYESGSFVISAAEPLEAVQFKPRRRVDEIGRQRPAFGVVEQHDAGPVLFLVFALRLA